MADSIDVWSIVGLPVLSGICHIAMPGLRERLMSAVAMVRAVGVLLLISVIPCLIPCLLWRGRYFWTFLYVWRAPDFGGFASCKARFVHSSGPVRVGCTDVSSSEERPWHGRYDHKPLFRWNLRQSVGLSKYVVSDGGTVGIRWPSGRTQKAAAACRRPHLHRDQRPGHPRRSLGHEALSGAPHRSSCPEVQRRHAQQTRLP